MSANSSLYDEVVRITHQYLGPAADRFVARQVDSHLGKTPSQLKKRDLADLIDWIRLAMSLLSEDERLINNYVADLNSLTSSQKNKVARV